VCANGEEVRLQRGQLCANARFRHDGRDPAEHGVQLVDGAVGFDARVRLRDAAAAEQARVAAVAGARVDP
jgi:hypothetical protein